MATMDKEKQLEYNLAVLKRRDAAISGVIDMSGHVVLYRFSEETQAGRMLHTSPWRLMCTMCQDCRLPLA